MSDLVERLRAVAEALKNDRPYAAGVAADAIAEVERLTEQVRRNDLQARLAIRRQSLAEAEVARLTRERDEAVAVLRLHHIMAVERGEIGLPDGDGGWIAINDGAEYCDSTLYNRTVQVIDQHPVFRPMPRGGWQHSQGWWENWLLETRMRRKVEAKLTTLTARTREVLAPFAAARVPYDFAADDEPVSLPIPGGAYRAANTLFNELKDTSNGQ